MNIFFYDVFGFEMWHAGMVTGITNGIIYKMRNAGFFRCIRHILTIPDFKLSPVFKKILDTENRITILHCFNQRFRVVHIAFYDLYIF